MPKALRGVYEDGRVTLLETSPVREKAEVIVIFPDRKHQRSVTEFEGLGKEIWEGIDAQEYVNEERKTWEKNC